MADYQKEETVSALDVFCLFSDDRLFDAPVDRGTWNDLDF
jgi:hypothetical protein